MKKLITKLLITNLIAAFGLVTQGHAANPVESGGVPVCGVLESFIGHVQLFDASRTQVIDVTPKQKLICGSWVSVEDGIAEISHRSGFDVEVGAHSFIQILDPASGSRLEKDHFTLLRGQMILKSTQKKALQVSTANARVIANQAEAFLLYSWVLLYVLSPLMISLFVLPATAGATKALFRSLIEVCAWKVVWSVIATLLWSAAMSEINNPKYQINFVTAICFNLLLAASLLLTPFIVHAITGAGITGLVSTVGGITVGAATVSPSTIGKAGAKGLRSGMEKTEPMREAAMNRITNYRNEKKLESIRKRGDRPKT